MRPGLTSPRWGSQAGGSPGTPPTRHRLRYYHVGYLASPRSRAGPPHGRWEGPVHAPCGFPGWPLQTALRSASRAPFPAWPSGTSLCCARAIEWVQGFRGQQTLKTPSSEAQAPRTPLQALVEPGGRTSPRRASGGPVAAEPRPAHTGECRPESGRDSGKEGSWMSHQVQS